MAKSTLQRIKPFIPIAIIVLLICLLSFYIPKEKLVEVVKNAGVFAPVVFILLNLTTFIIAPLSGTPIVAIGYYLFGSKVVLYGFVVILISSVINFWISRIWGVKLVSKIVGKKGMEEINEYTKEYGFLTLFVTRFFLRGFDDVISYAAGLTSMKFTPYLIISTLAPIPGTIALYYLSKLAGDVTQFTIIIVSFSYILFTIYIFARKYKGRKNRSQKVL